MTSITTTHSLIKHTLIGLATFTSLSLAGEIELNKTTPTQSDAKATEAAHVIHNVRTTAFTHTEGDHLQYGSQNAAGGSLKYGKVRSAAADWSMYPVGTVFQIDGDSNIYVVDDYGSALVGTGTIDLYKPSHSAMDAWGTRRVDIHVIKWGSYSKSLAILKPRQSKASHVRKMVSQIEAKNAA